MSGTSGAVDTVEVGHGILSHRDITVGLKQITQHPRSPLSNARVVLQQPAA